MNQPLGIRGFFSVLKGAFTRWSDRKGAQLGAAVAYYTAFSLAPLLLLAISISALVFGREAVEGHVVQQLSTLMGERSADMIQRMIQDIQRPAAGISAAIVGGISLLLGATGVMTEMKSGLNRLWGVEGRKGFRGLMWTRIEAVGMVLTVGFLLLVSLALSAAISAVGKFLNGYLPAPEPALHAFDLLLSFGIVLLLFAAIFRLLPDADIRWRDVWIGSSVTTVLFVAGKYAVGLYLGKSAAASAYGAAGSLLIILAWVYYSAQIFYFGAAFTSVYAERFGSGVRPGVAMKKSA